VPSVFTDKLQVSGQSSGQTLGFVSTFSLIDMAGAVLTNERMIQCLHDDIVCISTQKVSNLIKNNRKIKKDQKGIPELQQYCVGQLLVVSSRDLDLLTHVQL